MNRTGKNEKAAKPSQFLDNETILCSTSDELLSVLELNPDSGLSAKEVKHRLSIYGHNELIKKKRTPLLIDFLSNFANPLIVILLIAGAVSGAVGELPDVPPRLRGGLSGACGILQGEILRKPSGCLTFGFSGLRIEIFSF